MTIFKIYAQKLLSKAGIYHRIRASLFYDIYWMFFDNQIIKKRNDEVKFYLSMLNGFHKGCLIYDIGANHGYKTDIFLRLGAKVIAVDPDEANQEILRRKFLSYRFRKRPVIVIGKAVSDQNSVQTMWIDEPGSAFNTLSSKWSRTLREDASRFGRTVAFGSEVKVSTVTLADLISTFGQPFFVKIDVEGHEQYVLQSMGGAVPYLEFEVNLPEFREEGIKCIELLCHTGDNAEFNYAAAISKGLCLRKWLPGPEFLKVFSELGEKSIEVFCRTRAGGPDRTGTVRHRS